MFNFGSFTIGIIVGIIIGIAIEYISWLNRCKKNNLFNDDGILYEKQIIRRPKKSRRLYR